MIANKKITIFKLLISVSNSSYLDFNSDSDFFYLLIVSSSFLTFVSKVSIVTEYYFFISKIY